MIVIGVDPGTSILAAVLLEDSKALYWKIIHGARRRRPTKKEPYPPQPNPWLETYRMARELLYPPFTDCLDCLAVEAAAMSKNGRQDALAGCRQAIFDNISSRTWDGEIFATKIFLPVVPRSGKKALTGYAGADKMRMVKAAQAWLVRNHNDKLVAWRALGQREKEALADALGIALAAREKLINARQEDAARNSDAGQFPPATPID